MIAEGEEIVRRLQVVSQMRNFLLEVRQNNQAAFNRGEFPHKPPHDIRSDAEYWRNLQRQQQK
jgi:hypothetical protein